MQSATGTSQKAAVSSALPLVDKLLRGGQESAKISVKSKVKVQIGSARKRKLRQAFGG